MVIVDKIIFRRWKKSTIKHFSDKALVGRPCILWVQHNADYTFKKGGLKEVRREFDEYLCKIQEALADDSVPKEDEDWFDRIGD